MAFNSGEPPSVLADKWTERELRELAVLLAHEPPAEERIDFWMAPILAANINPWRGKGAAAVNPEDLKPDWWGNVADKQPKTNADWVAVLKGMTSALGGKV